MDNMKSIKKNWLASLSFLDNNIIYSVIIVILVLYSSTIFDNINAFVGNLFNFSLLKLLGILLIIYVAPKDTTIAILLAVSYVITIHYMVNNETFVSDKNMPAPHMGAPHMGSPHMGAPHMGSPHMGSPHMDAPHHAGAPHHKKNVEKYVDSEHKMMKNTQEEQNNTRKKVEHFFPTDNSTMGNSFDIRLTNTNVDTKQADYTNKNQPVKMNQNVKMNQSCLNTYTPEFETIGDPCVPTATFQNEFNAQGLNFPEGFNSPVSGSPL